jgi:hypothetical protein
MEKRAKISLILGAMAFGALSIFAVRAGVGKIVAEASSVEDGPTVKVRTLQTQPWSAPGLLGIGEVIYRVEYYSRPDARMSACVSLSGESLYEGKQVDIRWSGYDSADVEIGDASVFRWEGRAWESIPAPTQ